MRLDLLRLIPIGSSKLAIDSGANRSSLGALVSSVVGHYYLELLCHFVNMTQQRLLDH